MLSTLPDMQNNRVMVLCGAFLLFQSFLFIYHATYFFSYTPWVVFALLLSSQFNRSALLVRDFICFAVMAFMFDFLREAIYVLHQGFGWETYYQYVINFEKLFISSGTLSGFLQSIFVSAGHVSYLEKFCVLIYSTHFAFFIVTAMVIWSYFPQECWRYRYAFLSCCYIGLCLYVLVPTMPPWMAADKGYLPPVENIFHNIMQVKFGELIKLVDTNPIAAMPSLHVGFPFVCFLALTYHFGFKKTWPVFIYFLWVVFATVLLGAHYLADIFVGIILAIFCFYISYFKLPTGKPYIREVSQADYWEAGLVIIIFLLIKVVIKFSIISLLER